MLRCMALSWAESGVEPCNSAAKDSRWPCRYTSLLFPARFFCRGIYVLLEIGFLSSYSWCTVSSGTDPEFPRGRWLKELVNKTCSLTNCSEVC